MRPGGKFALLLCLLAVAVVGVYARVGGNDFVNLDDPVYVTENPHVKTGLAAENIVWAFQTGWGGNWHPLTWISHMMDAQLFGAGAAGPHYVSAGWHVVNTLLLYGVLRRMTGKNPGSAFVAALFGLHPLHVESVAWIAERKDVLSGFFFLLTLWWYARYVELTKTAGKGRTIFLALALAAFGGGLMSKPMLVTLPFVLLLLDFWPLRRFEMIPPRRLVAEKIPFFILAAISCAVTFLVQRQAGAVQSFEDCPLTERLENGVVSYLRYAEKTFWPVDLATPYADVHAWPWPIVGGAVVLLGLVSFAVIRWRRENPYLLTGWFWFLGMLVPVLGIVQVGAQAMADRYMYLPIIGIFVMVTWGAEWIFTQWRLPGWAVGLAAGMVLIACGARTVDQLQYWKNSEVLGEHAVAVTANNWMAEYNLGCELERQGRMSEALEHYRKAVEIQPRDADCLNRYGFALTKSGDYAEALPCFETALKLRPSFFELEYNIANCLLHLKRYDEALGHYQEFLQRQPDQVNALIGLGVCLGVKGDNGGAISEFESALKLEPENADAHFDLGEALAAQGKMDDAKRELTEALRLRPQWEEAESELKSLGP